MIAQASGRGSVVATPGEPDDADLKNILIEAYAGQNGFEA